MPRRPHTAPGDEAPVVTTNYAPTAYIKREFARRLSRVMLQRNMNQSDVAREMSKHTKGQSVHRSSVSHYVRGANLPGPIHLDALAQALNCKIDDLLPMDVMPQAGRDLMDIEIRDAGNGKAYVHLDQVMPWDMAVAILNIVKNPPAEADA